MSSSKRTSSSSRKKPSLHKSPQIPANPLDLPTAGDEDGISRLVSSLCTPEAVRENSEQVQQYNKTSQNDEDDDWDSAIANGDERDAVIEDVINTHED